MDFFKRHVVHIHALEGAVPKVGGYWWCFVCCLERLKVVVGTGGSICWSLPGVVAHFARFGQANSKGIVHDRAQSIGRVTEPTRQTKDGNDWRNFPHWQSDGHWRCEGESVGC